MIITETVKVKWTKSNKSYYEEKGYVFTIYNDEFEVKVVDLPPNSTIKVLVKCDYCDLQKEKPYSLYNNSIKSDIKKYACRKHSILKQKESNVLRYGTEDALGYFEELRKKKKEFRNQYYKEKRG